MAFSTAVSLSFPTASTARLSVPSSRRPYVYRNLGAKRARVSRVCWMSSSPAVTAAPMVLDMADDTRVSFQFNSEAVNDLAKGVNNLLISFKALQKEKSKQELLEYQYESDSLRFTVDCNPNIFPNAFSATAYVTVDDGTVRVSSSAQLTKLVDNIKAFKSAVAQSK